MDEDLKAQLQELVSNLGMDMTTFFTISAKQAVREQRIPFNISMDVPNEKSMRSDRKSVANEAEIEKGIVNESNHLSRRHKKYDQQ